MMTAQQPVLADAARVIEKPCDQVQEDEGYPSYYCDCKKTATPFSFGRIDTISDVTWYVTTITDLKKGLSAYWFADCSVQIDVFAYCSSIAPAVSMTVGRNQMRELDAAEITKKIESMGSNTSIYLESFHPYVRVTPIGGEGIVMAYPYNQGPSSTCAQPLKVINGMTMVSSEQESVYQLLPSDIQKDKQMFVQWKERHNAPADMWVTRNQCEGEELLRTTMSDSTLLFFPELAMLNAARENKDTLYFHFRHAENVVGRIMFRMNPKYIDNTMDTVVCEGKGLALVDTTLMETTSYGPHYVWQTADTVNVYLYNVTVTPADTLYDTVRVRAKQLPMLYKNQELIPKNGYGDYNILYTKKGQCSERYFLHVEHLVDTTSLVMDTTLCSGKTLTVSGMTFREDTIVQYQRWENEDTWAIVDLEVQFTEPEVEYDTIAIAPSRLGKEVVVLGTQIIVIKAYGDLDAVTYLAKDGCYHTRYITVVEKEEEIVTANIAVPEQKKVRVVLENGVLYIERDGARYTVMGVKTE